MSYFNEDIIKDKLINDISKLAQELDVSVMFDGLEDMTFDNLQSLHTELYHQYQEAEFNGEIYQNTE